MMNIRMKRNPPARGTQSRRCGRAWSVAAACLCLGVFGFAGCGSSESRSPEASPGEITVATNDPVDFSAVARAFESADAATKFSVNEILVVARSGAYADARMQLLRLTRHPALTAPQKQALEQLANDLQKLPARQR
jgi:hypothetical protein